MTSTPAAKSRLGNKPITYSVNARGMGRLRRRALARDRGYLSPFRYEIVLMRPAKRGPSISTPSSTRAPPSGFAPSGDGGTCTEFSPRSRRSTARQRSSFTGSCSSRTCFGHASGDAAAISSTDAQDILHAVLENRSPAHPRGHKGSAHKAARRSPVRRSGLRLVPRTARALPLAVTDEGRLTTAPRAPMSCSTTRAIMISSHDSSSARPELLFEHTDTDLGPGRSRTPCQLRSSRKRNASSCAARAGAARPRRQEVVRVCRDTRGCGSRAVVMP